ncbi:MAG: ISKra4 family transposase [Acidobacteria bacterium]|nr:ISKra4 family transposase [Acidobacteriota bacterium]
MRVVPPRAAASDPAPYAAAEAAFGEAKAYLSSREAQRMSESDLERELHRRGQELMRKLLQGHLDQRSPGEAAGPVEGADGVERSQRRVHERRLETTFGTVAVERVGYARPGQNSLHPLDAALNLPPERYSLEVRRRVAEAAASRSFDEALFDLSRSTGAEVPKRQAEQLVARAAEDFDAFYEARRAADGEPPPEGSVVVLTFDGTGVVLHRDDLREATRKAAEKRREQLSRFKRLKPGEKKHSKRMAAVAAVYTTAPFVRSPEQFLQSLMPRQPGAKPPLVRPRPVAKRVWASLEREPAEVVAEAMLEAERQDPEHVKRWVVLVDGAETQLDLVEAGAAAYGVDVTVVLDIIHVVEYVWKAAHVFHREGSPDLEYWVWTRVQRI